MPHQAPPSLGSFLLAFTWQRALGGRCEQESRRVPDVNNHSHLYPYQNRHFGRRRQPERNLPRPSTSRCQETPSASGSAVLAFTVVAEGARSRRCAPPWRPAGWWQGHGVGRGARTVMRRATSTDGDPQVGDDFCCALAGVPNCRALLSVGVDRRPGSRLPPHQAALDTDRDGLIHQQSRIGPGQTPSRGVDR